MAPESIVSLRGVINRFGDHTIHDGLDLDIRAGEILGLIGSSGAGKSVLLRSILGLRPIQGGKITVMGTELGPATEKERQRIRQQWAVLFQDGALFSSLTVSENIQTPLREFAKAPPAFMKDVAAMKIHLVGLPAEAGRLYPSELSGGMRKRAGLARALALDPALLFLDEPTAGLDPISAAAFDDLIVSLRETLGLTVCMITHDLDSLHALCDRVAVLAEKRIYAIGAIAELMDIQYPWIQNYFRGPRGRAAAQAPRGQGA
jgi:phospholipid/cholesterol/gamma-HCH transport system ATP-binding protein